MPKSEISQIDSCPRGFPHRFKNILKKPLVDCRCDYLDCGGAQKNIHMGVFYLVMLYYCSMPTTQLYFRYSPIYDRSIATLSKVELLDNQISDGFSFANDFAHYWQDKNDKVFEYYNELGLVLADFWLAYPVHVQKNIVPFNDPLTFFIKDNFDECAATVTHEICHTFFSYFANNERAVELWKPIAEKFSNEPNDVQEHILINVLAAGVYFKIFDSNKAIELIKMETEYPSLAQSWKIIYNSIDGEFEKLKKPLEVLKTLTR